MSKRIVILGAGESGTGTAILAKKHDFDVFVSDSSRIHSRYKALLDEYEISYEEEKHSDWHILAADEIVKSPGIPNKAEIVQKIIKKEIPIISELEFADRFTNAKKICVTGSNGKTTTTSLIYHMMLKAGLNVGFAGNMGKSFAYQVATEAYEYYVLEISSFQLDNMYEFKADIAILLNITPDHLDRYDYDLERYVNSKFRIIQNLSEDNYFIFCNDDEITIKHLERIVSKATQLRFTAVEEHVKGAYIKDNQMNIRFDDIDFSMSLEELSLKGRHNTYNSMAAGIAGNVLRIRKSVIRESLSDFQGVEHRLEQYMTVHGIQFINDSKATNVNSTYYALDSMRPGVIWIAGGVDKGNDYTLLADLVSDKVKAIVCLGKDNTKLHEAFGKLIPDIVDVDNMHDAVRSAYYLAGNGNTVLLSPACASFDRFEDFEDRGRQFKLYVREL